MLAEPIARSLDLDDDGVVKQPIEQRGGDDGIAKNLAPFGAASRSRRIEWCHIKLNPGGGEIDANPVNQPAALLRYREPLTTVRNACENLDGLVRVTLLPKIPVQESA